MNISHEIHAMIAKKSRILFRFGEFTVHTIYIFTKIACHQSPQSLEPIFKSRSNRNRLLKKQMHLKPYSVSYEIINALLLKP